MCQWGTNARVTLCKPQQISGRRVVEVDACIAHLVQRLNDAGVETIGACCGHGQENGSIVLRDGRILVLD